MVTPGTVFGLLTVIGTAEPRRKPSGRLDQQVRVQCACGSPERVVSASNVRSGNTTSCGCSRRAPRPARRSEIVGYTGMHTRLNRDRGPASALVCVDCGGPASQWSYDGLDEDETTEEVRGYVVAFSLDIDHYAPRCAPCHHAYDLREKATCKRGHPFADAYRDANGKRLACRQCAAERHAATATCRRGHRLALTGILKGPMAARLTCWVCRAMDGRYDR